MSSILLIMDVGEPIRSVIPGLQGPVLRVLAGALRPLTAREVARLLEGTGSQRGVLDVLNRLVEHGLVDREDRPPAALFRVNRDHVAAPAIEQLAYLRAALLVRLREHVTSWDVPAVLVALFGSAARGDGGPRSDLDILVVRKEDAASETWERQVDGLWTAARRWAGNYVQIVEYSATELRQRADDGNRFVQNLVREAIPLTEMSVRDFLAEPVWSHVS